MFGEEEGKELAGKEGGRKGGYTIGNSRKNRGRKERELRILRAEL